MTQAIYSPVPIILDTDPGIDDAMALTAALFLSDIDLRLITTVAGNVSVDKTTHNALKLLEFYGKSIPVAQGVARPLTRTLATASDIHGHSGMDGYDFPLPTLSPIALNAVEAIRQELIASQTPITLVPIGPLTNIALLLTLYPECKKNIKQIVLMGGSASRGNYTPNAEFNIAVDPEAAKIVFASGLEIVMCGLDVTNKATLTPDMLAQLPTMNRSAAMLHALFKHYRGGSMQTGLKMHDLCAIAYLVKPEFFTIQRTFVDVETQGEYTTGTTVVDLMNKLNKPANVQVCLDIDVDAFRQWFLMILQQLP